MISIIVPNYNHSAFLIERLDSILNQSYQDFELILLDDCSTDNSVDILEAYSKHDKVTHFVKNTMNSGSPFKQWYKGIALAKYDWIWIAESDDVAEHDFLEQLLKEVNQEKGLVYCRSKKIDENSEQVDDDYFWPDGLDQNKWKSDYSSDGVKEICSSLRYRNTIPNASACIFNKKFIPSIGEVEKFKFAGDWVFWILLLKSCEMSFLSKPLNKFRHHSTTSRTTKSKDLEVKRLKEYMSSIKLATDVCKGSGAKVNHANYNWIFSEIKKKKRKLGMSYYFPPLPNKLLRHYYVYIRK